MTESEIMTYLCYNDPRHPDGAHHLNRITGHEEDNAGLRYPCGSCDHCFHGLPRLAEEALQLRVELKTQYEQVGQLADEAWRLRAQLAAAKEVAR